MVRTRVGYAGGTHPNPTYHDLGDQSESIEIDFDPAKTSYAKLLDIFWESHEPRSKSWSAQYRSAIFWRNEEQKRLALETKAREEKKRGTLYTGIEAYSGFTLAEDYHQKYVLRGSRLMKDFQKLSASDFVNSTAAARLNGFLAGDGDAATLRAEIDRYGLSPEGKARLLAGKDAGGATCGN